MEIGQDQAIARKHSWPLAGTFGWESAMAASLCGDTLAYRTLLQESARWLRRYYGVRLAPFAIDDAVRDALLALHSRRHTFDTSRAFLPWLAAIARYTIERNANKASVARDITSPFIRSLHIY